MPGDTVDKGTVADDVGTAAPDDKTIIIQKNKINWNTNLLVLVSSELLDLFRLLNVISLANVAVTYRMHCTLYHYGEIKTLLHEQNGSKHTNLMSPSLYPIFALFQQHRSNSK